MTTKIGGIVVDIDARLTKMEASLAKADSNFQRFERNVKTRGAGLQSALDGIDAKFRTFAATAATLGAGIAIAGITSLATNVLKFADDLATAADQANISVERFQTLKEAFRTLEIDGDQFDKAMKRLQGTLGDVQRGVKDEATKALDEMGISARVLSGEIRTTDELLDALAASAKTSGTEAEFASNMVDIFGRRVGIDMAAALRDGGDALHALEQQFIDTGLVIDQQMIDKLADANETIDRFSASAANQFAIWAAATISAFEDVGYWADKLGLKLAQLSPFGDPDKFLPRIKAYETRRATEAVRDVFGALGFSEPEAEPDRTPITPRPSGGGSRQARAARAPRESRRDPEKWWEWQTAAERRADVAFQAESTPLGITGFGISLGDLEEARGNIDAILVDVRSMEEVQLPDIGSMLSEEEQRRLEDFAFNFNRDLSAGLADAIIYGEDLGDVLEDTFKRAAAAALESGILNLITGGKEGVSFSSMFASIFGGPRASGGPVSAGKAYLVGEEGPELFAPGSSGSIIPNDRLSEANPAVSAVSGFSGRVVIELRDDMLDARIAEGSGITVMRMHPAMKADTIRSYEDMRGRR